MKLIRTLASWRPNLTGYRDVEEADKIALKSRARRHIELHDEVAELDDMIEAIVKDLAPELIACNCVGLTAAARLLFTAGGPACHLRHAQSRTVRRLPFMRLFLVVGQKEESGRNQLRPSLEQER